MKRFVCILLAVFCLLTLMPVSASAETYALGDTDISLYVDNAQWYVFTRDNIRNNPELEELGLTYEDLDEVFQSNNAYMDAILIYDDGNYLELFVRKTRLTTGLVNLSDYDDDEVLKMARDAAREAGVEDYAVFKTSRYKFAELNYVDSGYYLREFVTCVNKDGYTMTFQSTSPLTEWEHEEIESIMESIQFDVDPTLKEKKSSGMGRVGGTVLGGAIVGGVTGLIKSLIRPGKKKKRTEEAQANGPEIP